MYGVNPMLEVKIQVKGHINKDWSSRFGCLAVSHEKDGNTTFSGLLRDQSELRGVLSSLSDLGLDLIFVNTTSENTKPCLEKEVIYNK